MLFQTNRRDFEPRKGCGKNVFLLCYYICWNNLDALHIFSPIYRLQWNHTSIDAFEQTTLSDRSQFQLSRIIPGLRKKNHRISNDLSEICVAFAEHISSTECVSVNVGKCVVWTRISPMMFMSISKIQGDQNHNYKYLSNFISRKSHISFCEFLDLFVILAWILDHGHGRKLINSQFNSWTLQ